MSESTEHPGATAPGSVPEAVATPSGGRPGEMDVSSQLAALTEAVNRLARMPHPARVAEEPATAPASSATPDAGTAARAAGGNLADVRERYVREHLADLPEAYRRQMPQAGHEPQLAEAERAIRRQFREDLRATLGPAAMQEVGGDIPGGHGPAAGVDYARLSSVQQITLGLRDAPPVGPGHAAVVRPPASGNATHENAHDVAPAGAD